MANRNDTCARSLLALIPPLMQEIRQSMRKGRGPGLSVSQFRTLAMIAHHPGASLADVAAHVGLGSPAMSVLVDGLVRRRLLTRVSAANDRRRSSLGLTTRGRAVHDQAWKATWRMLATRLSSMPGDDVATIARAVTLLQGILKPQPTATEEA